MHAFNAVDGSSSSNSSNSSIGEAAAVSDAIGVYAGGCNYGGKQNPLSPSRSRRSTSRESRADRSPSVGWALHVVAPAQLQRQQWGVPEAGLLLVAYAPALGVQKRTWTAGIWHVNPHGLSP